MEQPTNSRARYKIQDTNLIQTISPGEETKETHRRWKHIYPTRRKTTDSSIGNQVSQIQTYLSKILFTHEHFALMAKWGGLNLTSDSNERTQRISELQRFKQILKIDDINVLVKGHFLLEAQSLHVDGCGLKLIVIYVDKCNEDDGAGYKFFYIDGSHRMLGEHKKHAQTSQLPMKEVTEKTVKPGDCIVLFESTIHGGGPSSSFESICGEEATQDSKRYKRLHLEQFRWFGNGTSSPGLLPVDVSFQFTFNLYACPSADSAPNRTNTWYSKTDKLIEGECCGKCEELLTSEDFEWGVCKHPVHTRCLKESLRDTCPLCKPTRKWIQDSSAIDFKHEIDRLKEGRNIEGILENSCNDFIMAIHSGKRILPKRSFRDI